MGKPRLLLLCPTPRDLHHLNSREIRDRYEVIPFGEYFDHPENFEVGPFLQKAFDYLENNPGIQGILGPGDYPESILASLIATKSGLSGPSPESVFLCQHKYYSRLEQKEAAPQVVPRFFAVPLSQDWKEEEIPLPFPFFVKPAKGVLSLFSRPVSSFEEFSRVLQESRGNLPPWVKAFNRLLQEAGLERRFPLGGECLLAEELISGDQVTLEGYVHRGEVHLIDIVDSIFYPGTRSFQRFQCPSHLPRSVQEEMLEVSAKVLKRIGFDQCIFNVEFVYHPEEKRLHLLEINSRIAHQFAGMMEAVHGCNTYEILIDLALGQKPKFRRFGGADRSAASFVLRTFEDRNVEAVPTPEEILKFSGAFPRPTLKTSFKRGAVYPTTFAKIPKATVTPS